METRADFARVNKNPRRTFRKEAPRVFVDQSV